MDARCSFGTISAFLGATRDLAEQQSTKSNAWLPVLDRLFSPDTSQRSAPGLGLIDAISAHWRTASFKDLLKGWREGPYERHLRRLAPQRETLELNRKTVHLQVSVLNHPVVIETSTGPLRDWNKRTDFDGATEYLAWDRPRRYWAWQELYCIHSQLSSPAVIDLLRHSRLRVRNVFYLPVIQALSDFESRTRDADERVQPDGLIPIDKHVVDSRCSHTRGRPSTTSPLDGDRLRPVGATSPHLLQGHVLERRLTNPSSHHLVRLTSAHTYPLSLQSAATRRAVACSADNPRLSRGHRQLHIHSIDVLPGTVRQAVYGARENQLHRVRRRTHSRRIPVGVINTAPVPQIRCFVEMHT